MIKIYNSLTNKLEEFKPIKEGEISMYVCGPTVYSTIHIGNSRPVIFFDTVARFFTYLGYNVKFVSNFTDIDDKIIKKALQEGVDEKVISERYIEDISNIYKKLNCLPHFKNPKVTENMENIIKFINEMIEIGGAYVADGDVYFDVLKIKEYGVLSGQTVENLLNGVRIENNDKKHNPIDFTLWKKTDAGIKWDSPFGEGRPGWHTECVVMIDDIFKGPIDIHGGGNDLKFPHHDNEIAQSLCLHNHKIANYWIHNGRIDLNGDKMSKSTGNVLWVNDLLERVPYQVYRLMMLNVPYRQLLNFKEDLFVQSTNDYEKIKRAYISLYRKLELVGAIDFDCEVVKEEIVNVKNEFIKSMKNDFNTANAITSIFSLTKLANVYIRNPQTSNEDLMQVLKCMYDMLWVLGIEVEVKALTNDEKELVKNWNQAKKEKNFELADKLRQEIIDKNIVL